MAKKRSTTKRELIDTRTDKRSVKRRADGTSKESDDESRSAQADGGSRRRRPRPARVTKGTSQQTVSPRSADLSLRHEYDDPFERAIEPLRLWLIFLTVVFAMTVSFGSWRRGLESLGVGHSFSFVVAIVADVFLILILLVNEVAWTKLTSVRLGVSRATLIGAVISIGVRIGVVYLYGWISWRGGGDWWDLF